MRPCCEVCLLFRLLYVRCKQPASFAARALHVYTATAPYIMPQAQPSCPVSALLGCTENICAELHGVGPA
jgi:hypothetical protein